MLNKLLDSLIVLALILLGIAWLAVAPEAQADEPQVITQSPRDAFACPGMHAEWLDDKTVECFREKP